MKNVAHTRDCAIDGSSVTQVAFDKFDVEVGEVRVRPFLADECTQRKTGFDKFVRDSRANEPACTGDKNLALSVHPSRIPICRGFEPRRPIGEPASNDRDLSPKQLLRSIMEPLAQTAGPARGND